MKTLALGWPGAVVGGIGAVGMLLARHTYWLFLFFCLLLLAESSVGLWYRFGSKQS